MTHSIRATALVVACAWPAAAQQAPDPTRLTSNFGVFLRSTQIGSEQVTVTDGADGWTIAASGRIGPPVDLVTRTLNVRYDANGQLLELTVDSTVRSMVFGMHITVDGATATTHIYNAGQDIDRRDTLTPGTILMPNLFFAAYEALTRRLRTAVSDSTVPVYQGGIAPFALLVGDSDVERIQTVARLIVARHTRATMRTPAGPEVTIDLWGDEGGHLLRVSVPAQGLDYVREDIAAVSARRVTVSRPGDEAVQIPANGFNLAGTLSKPTASPTPPARPRHPAVVLVPGSGPLDRDETIAGIPIFGQLAGALADAGFAVLRYDKRGLGQSGGRTENAGLVDYADDLRAAVKFLSGRKDIDAKRIAVAGHSEGGDAALLVAAKDTNVAAVVLMGVPGLSGSDLLLAQQQRALARSTLTAAEKQARVEFQKRMHEAILTGKGWEGVPAEIRRQVDNPEFQSLLTFDPAKVIPQVRQPLFIVQGSLDTQVEPANADRLETMARARKRQAPVEVAKIAGVNHLFAAATTGEMDEYSTLKEKQITPLLGSSIVSWLMKHLPPAR